MRKGLKKLTALFCSAVLAAGSLPGVVLAVGGDDGTVVYTEDFESGSEVENEIKNKINGWTYKSDTKDDGSEVASIWVGDNKSGSNNALRFASTEYFKEISANLNFKESGISKSTNADEAAEILDWYLGKNIKLSFKTKFEIQGRSNEDMHESFIRLKDGDVTIAELKTKYDELYVSTGESSEEKIKTVDVSNGNNVWYTVGPMSIK